MGTGDGGPRAELWQLPLCPPRPRQESQSGGVPRSLKGSKWGHNPRKAHLQNLTQFFIPSAREAEAENESQGSYG